jgi:hypothetical protein
VESRYAINFIGAPTAVIQVKVMTGESEGDIHPHPKGNIHKHIISVC